MKAILILLTCPLFAFAQVGAIREETKTTNPDGSVTFTRKFDPPVQPPAVEYRAPVAAAPTVRYMLVQPEVRYVAAPTYAAPAVMYAVPVGAKTPVGEVRYGLFGLRREVFHADGSSTRYGVMGRKR